MLKCEFALDKAIIYLDSSKLLSKDLKDNTGLSIIHEHLGSIYLEKKEAFKARKYFDSAITYAKISDDKKAIYWGHLGLAKAASVMANYKTAYNALDQAITIKDSLLPDEKRDELATLKAKYEYEKEKAILKANFEKNKALDKAKIKQQTLIRNFSIGGVILIGFFLFYYLKQRHKKEKLKEIYTTETRISRKVHDELANDVYDIMNRVQNKSQLKQEAILKQLEEVYQKTRDISYENSTINLSDTHFYLELKEMLSAYLNKDMGIITKGLNKELWRGLSDYKKIVIVRVLKELMTNMKKHSKASNVVLTFKKERKKLIITYADDGVGLKNTDNFKRNGLQNAENRIRHINGILIFDTNSKKGVKLKISIPV